MAEDERATQDHAHGRHEHAARRFDPAHLLAQEAHWRQGMDGPDLLRPLIVGDERLLVDVGAGAGRLALDAAALLPRGRVLAVDRQQDMVALLERRFREAGQTNARALLADAEHLPLVDGEADAVLMSVVLHDMADPAAVLREMRRVLGPAGRLLLIEFRPGALDGGPPRELLFEPDDLVARLALAGFRPDSPIDGPGPLYRLLARPAG